MTVENFEILIEFSEIIDNFIFSIKFLKFEFVPVEKTTSKKISKKNFKKKYQKISQAPPASAARLESK